MTTRAIILGTVLALATMPALAQSHTKQTITNPKNLPPGQIYNQNGPVKGSPGASGYTPGHEMQQNGPRSSTAPSASGYTPGHAPGK